MINNIVDWTRICWLNKSYHAGIKNLLGRVYPLTDAERYLRTLDQLVSMLDNIYDEYKEYIKAKEVLDIKE